MRAALSWRQAATALALTATLALTGCISTPPPSYQPGIDNTERLLGGSSKLGVGTFDAAPGIDNRSLGMRGSSLKGGSDGRFSTYLQEALVAELREAGRLDPGSTTVVTGRLLENKLNAGSSKYGSASMAAEFVVTRGGEQVYARTLRVEHRWDSSFIGAIAIPAAVQGYAATVQVLLGELFADPAFKQATDPAPAQP